MLGQKSFNGLRFLEFIPDGQMRKLPLIIYLHGAGDAFCAGSLYGIYKGYTDREILEFGSMCAAVSLRVPDAVSGLTDEKGIRDFCKNLSRRFLEIR